MWINKKAYREWATEVRAVIEAAKLQAQNLFGQIDARDRTIRQLEKELATMRANLALAIEHHSVTEGKLKATRAYADTWRLQLNHLQLERGDLMARLLPGYSVRAPQIEMQAEFLPPGLDFEDMGDDRAHHFGYAPEHPIEGQPANVPQRPRPEDGLERMDEPTPLLDPQEG